MLHAETGDAARAGPDPVSRPWSPRARQYLTLKCRSKRSPLASSRFPAVVVIGTLMGTFHQGKAILVVGKVCRRAGGWLWSGPATGRFGGRSRPFLRGRTREPGVASSCQGMAVLVVGSARGVVGQIPVRRVIPSVSPLPEFLLTEFLLPCCFFAGLAAAWWSRFSDVHPTRRTRGHSTTPYRRSCRKARCIAGSL